MVTATPQSPFDASQSTKDALKDGADAGGEAGKSQKEQPKRKLMFRVFTGSNLNASTDGIPVSLVMRVYRLRGLNDFQGKTFQGFLEDTKGGAATSNEVVSESQMMLLPGRSYISLEEIPWDARYLGVVALFRGPAEHRWRFIYDVEKSVDSGITIGAHACALTSTAGDLAVAPPTAADTLSTITCPAPK